MPAQELDELFAKTLSDEYESHEAWNAVTALHMLGSREVFEQAAAWCSSPEPMKRARGADVLAQIGKTADHPCINFADETFAVVSGLVARETEPLPLASAIHALGHMNDPRTVRLLVEYRSHSDENVRFAVACALGSFADDPIATPALIQLTTDADADVRDWATFGLGVLGQSDSPEIRDTLAARLNDADDDAREEAMIGLARRRDHRVLSLLIASLEAEFITDRVIEAASEMLGLQHGDERWDGTDYADALRKKFIV